MTPKVLLFVSEGSLSQSLSTLVQRRGCEVERYDSAEGAMEAVSREKYDLALIDLTIEGGWESYVRIRTAPSGFSIPVLLMMSGETAGSRYMAPPSSGHLTLLNQKDLEEIKKGVDKILLSSEEGGSDGKARTEGNPMVGKAS